MFKFMRMFIITLYFGGDNGQSEANRKKEAENKRREEEANAKNAEAYYNGLKTKYEAYLLENKNKIYDESVKYITEAKTKDIKQAGNLLSEWDYQEKMRRLKARQGVGQTDINEYEKIRSERQAAKDRLSRGDEYWNNQLLSAREKRVRDWNRNKRLDFGEYIKKDPMYGEFNGELDKIYMDRTFIGRDVKNKRPRMLYGYKPVKFGGKISDPTYEDYFKDGVNQITDNTRPDLPTRTYRSRSRRRLLDYAHRRY